MGCEVSDLYAHGSLPSSRPVGDLITLQDCAFDEFDLVPNIDDLLKVLPSEPMRHNVIQSDSPDEEVGLIAEV